MTSKRGGDNDISDGNLDFYGVILEEEIQLSLAELSRGCSVHAEFIVELVDEGILEPINRETSQWLFPGVSLKRAKTALNLQRDLGINLAGVALALDLMEELERIRVDLDSSVR